MSSSLARSVLAGSLLAAATALSPMAASASDESARQAFQQGEYEKAYKQWLPLAKSGDPKAQYMIGVLYDHGYNVPRNYQEAARWYKRAAEQGHAQAAFSLGFLYYNGGQGEVADGSIKPNPKKAATWLRQAAYADSFPLAAYLLGQMYQQGRGVAANASEACYWTRQGAKGGIAAAQFNAGLMLARGEGCEQDPVAAYKWFARAAKQNYPGAEANRKRLASELSSKQLEKARMALDSAG